MKANKDEYKKIQAKILQHLFDTAKPASVADIGKLINCSQSETDYHIDQLREQRLVESHTFGTAQHPVRGIEITATGRKHIMES